MDGTNKLVVRKTWHHGRARDGWPLVPSWVTEPMMPTDGEVVPLFL